MKRVMRAVLIIGLAVIACAIAFGDMSRDVVDRLNMVLVPIVVVLLSVTFHAVYRFRRACVEWERARRT